MIPDDKLLQPERLDRIKSAIEAKKTVKVSELSQACMVSENTIRRDLIELEEMGYCLRTKGGATLLEQIHDQSPFSNRLAIQKKGKHNIAIKASTLVGSGSTIILDSGTTALELAEELSKKDHITIITPSLAAAEILSGINGITLILPGGIVNQFSRSLTGQPAEQFFAGIHVDILFLAVKAVSLKTGLSDHTLIESAVKQQMIKAADRVIVLADHSKLGKNALSRICSIEEIDTLITDESADPDFIAKLEDAGISVII
ncbi:MAG: DeoR/GlpR transcriptional regulator [Spirochaetales bacterium]|nr:DeoR/GlpR transcriptional regulator [Spirochaetales bacterium]